MWVQLDTAPDHAPGRVAGARARRGASGALQVSGDPGRVIYLRDGCLAFAGSAAVPEPGPRLVNSRRLAADQGKRAEDSQPDGRAGELMLRRGLTDPAERPGLVWPVTLDALVALAMPPSLTWYVRWRRRPVTIARMPVSGSPGFSAAFSAAGRHTVQVRA